MNKSIFHTRFVCLIVAGLSCGLLFANEEAPSAGEKEKTYQKDVIKTDANDLTITFIGHGTLMFEYAGKVIHVDPWTRLADYSKLPDADVVLITHDHGDHLDPKAIDEVRKDGTVIYLPENCKDKVSGSKVVANGKTIEAAGLKIEVVPAYNIERPGNRVFHPKGQGNGYVITFGKKRVYVAGDTENTPEMKALKKIDVAFLPMNLPYTMTPEMVADAAKAFKPKILYPYHYGQTKVEDLVKLLADEKDIEVRVRKME